MPRRVVWCHVASRCVALRTNTPLRFARLTLIPRTLTPLRLIRSRAASLQPQLVSFRGPTHVFQLNFTCGVIGPIIEFIIINCLYFRLVSSCKVVVREEDVRHAPRREVTNLLRQLLGEEGHIHQHSEFLADVICPLFFSFSAFFPPEFHYFSHLSPCFSRVFPRKLCMRDSETKRIQVIP